MPSNLEYAAVKEHVIDLQRILEETELHAARLADALDALYEYIQQCSSAGIAPSVYEADFRKNKALDGPDE